MGKLLFEAEAGRRRHGAPVHAEHAAFRQLLFQVFKDGGNAFLAGFLQCDGRTAKLLFALEEISSIHPKRGFVLQHNERAGRACEAGHICARLEMRAHIFRKVEIIRGDIIPRIPRFAHLCAQGCKALLNRLHECSFLNFGKNNPRKLREWG